jgi:hypothetical protein
MIKHRRMMIVRKAACKGQAIDAHLSSKSLKQKDHLGDQEVEVLLNRPKSCLALFNDAFDSSENII